jgi:hypothetical protein
MNRVVKYTMYTVNCKIRLIIYQAKLPKDLWCLVTEYTVWIKNRIPTKALSFGKNRKLSLAKTLYKAYRESLPDFTELQVFRYTA